MECRRDHDDLFRLDVGRPDHRGPLLGAIGYGLGEVGGRARKHRPAQVGKPCLQLRIAESSVDLSDKFVDYLNSRFPGCTEAKYRTRLVTRNEVAHCRNIW